MAADPPPGRPRAGVDFAGNLRQGHPWRQVPRSPGWALGRLRLALAPQARRPRPSGPLRRPRRLRRDANRVHLGRRRATAVKLGKGPPGLRRDCCIVHCEDPSGPLLVFTMQLGLETHLRLL